MDEDDVAVSWRTTRRLQLQTDSILKPCARIVAANLTCFLAACAHVVNELRALREPEGLLEGTEVGEPNV